MPQTNVIIKIHPVLLFTLYNTKNIAYHFTEELILYADKIMVMGNSKNSHAFNFAIILQKSRKFDAREIYMFYSSCYCLNSIPNFSQLFQFIPVHRLFSHSQCCHNNGHRVLTSRR